MNFRAGEIIGLDKPYGVSSFWALARVRWLISQRIGSKIKIGHAGTLDPLATGVLLLCTGRATKRIDDLQRHTKEYVATMQLGATTPSFDREHTVDHTFPTQHITLALVQQTIGRFVGEVSQVPPTYSACKVNGQRAYKMMRSAESKRKNSKAAVATDEVALKPKVVRIDEIELLAFDAERKLLTLRVVCGKGTYIRSLARDIGVAMGSGAFLTDLRRTRVGNIAADHCIALDRFEEWLAAQSVDDTTQQ